MDIVIEFVLELVFGSILESDKVKVRTKTVMMSLMFVAVEALFLFCLYYLIREGNRPILILLVLGVCIWFGKVGIRETIDGHKRGWKQDRGY